MNSQLLPDDDGWPEDKVLLADLSSLNAVVTRYVLRHLDADAGQAEPISVEDEHALGLRLVELGERLQRRAARREPSVGAVIEGERVSRPTHEPNQKPGGDPAPSHG